MHCKDTTVELDVYPEEPEVLVMTCVVGCHHDIGKLWESIYLGHKKFLEKISFPLSGHLENDTVLITPHSLTSLLTLRPAIFALGGGFSSKSRQNLRPAGLSLFCLKVEIVVENIFWR